MTKDPFEQYKLPLGLTEGVVIRLEGTKAAFTVQLPGRMNEDFNMRLMNQLSVQVDDEGSVKVDAIAFQAARRELFFDDCILDFEGLPAGMSLSEFFMKYPLAKRVLYDKATEMAEKADEEAEEALGKLGSSSLGERSGEEDSNSTISLSKAG